MSAGNALLRAVHACLAGDAELTAALAADVVSDRLLARPKLPAIVIGELETRDFSTASDAGEEHLLTLEVFSRAEGRRQALARAARIVALLHDAALALEGAELVSLMHQRTVSRREPASPLPSGGLYAARLRFRAVTEPDA